MSHTENIKQGNKLLVYFEISYFHKKKEKKVEKFIDSIYYIFTSCRSWFDHEPRFDKLAFIHLLLIT